MSKPNDEHPEYGAIKDTWDACRDAVTGQRAIHAAGTKYLPKLNGQTDEEYKAYRKRALFFNASGRTLEGMLGLVFRRKPVIELPEALQQWAGDITLTGKSLEGFTKDCTEEAITVGRGGILVEYPPQPQFDAPLTQGQAEALSFRPYLTHYKAESVINWRSERVGNVTMLVDLYLREIEGGIEQIRQLVLLSQGYTQIIWRKDNKNTWVIVDEQIPVMNGQPLRLIPFYFYGPKEGGCECQNPPIEDLVYVNLSHYMNSADLENGAHVSGLPTPYITGVQAEKDESGGMINQLHLGTGTSWLISNPEAKVGFLQVGADGFTSLERLMDRKQEQMAALGARMLAGEKRDAETAETHTIKRGGENSVLMALAGSVEMTVTKALQFMAEWAGITGEIRLELNKDFLPQPMDAAMLTAVVKSWQSGAISDQTLFEALKAGEVVGDTLSYEEEQERKSESTPALATIE